jgi:hypothetical protein
VLLKNPFSDSAVIDLTVSGALGSIAIAIGPRFVLRVNVPAATVGALAAAADDDDDVAVEPLEEQPATSTATAAIDKAVPETEPNEI